MLIYVIAGEPSGDLLGGKLMAALMAETHGQVRFAGIGGRSMEQQGLTSLFPMADLSVMGLVEVLPRIPKILGRVRQTVAHIGMLRPDAIVTIDSWGFTGRVQKALQKHYPDIARIHYVAPMVWAWKPKRAKTLAGVLDLLMTLLPFEPQWFIKEGLASIHVGHPVIECGADQGEGDRFRQLHGIGPDQPMLVLLPGSRHSETSRLLPVFRDAVAILRASHPDLRIVVPTVETVADSVQAAVDEWGMGAIVLHDRSATYDAFAAADVALAASGTVSLELAMAGLCSVIAYRVSPVTAFLAKNVFGLKIRWASLINMVMDRAIMPEFLQEKCQPHHLAEAVEGYLINSDLRQAARQDMAQAMQRLGYGQDSPSRRAAQAVLHHLTHKRTQP